MIHRKSVEKQAFMPEKEVKARIKVIKEDITKISVDAIVNAANSSLLVGGGVDRAIHRAGGSKISDECRIIRNKQGKCPVGKAVITNAGKLPAKYVIHAVGPIWRGGNANEDSLLANAYISSLKLAEENGVEVISFPNISTGIYHFPKKRAAQIALATVNDFINSNNKIKEVVFVCFDNENYRIYSSLVDKSDQ